MKNLKQYFAITIMALVISLFSSTTFAIGNENSNDLNDFKITAVENMGTSHTDVWNLEYSNSANSIKIVKSVEKGVTQYIVRGKFLEVRYVSSKKGFGARLIKNSEAHVPSAIRDNVINLDAVKQQRIISSEPVNDQTALSLIAAYLPELVNNNYKHILQ
ncbi:hypothetical protein [Prolixibacter bellariivorans]|nr:hypothetical protein [Prolixibacter bellariivorans]